jgi:large subunit ribosomal protein L10
MLNSEKHAVVETYTEKFKEAKCVYIAEYEGITVEKVTEVRNKFREQNIEYKVIKNRLAKRALNNAGISDLNDFLTGANTYVIGYDDPVAPAKIFDEFNKKVEILKLKAVLFEGKVLSADEAKDISKLPSRDALLGKLVGMLQSPMTKFAATIKAPMQNFVGVLNALKDTKE